MSSITHITEWTHAKLVAFFESQFCSLESLPEDGGFLTTFTASDCSCGCKANVVNRAGWFCKCGNYNLLSRYGFVFPWKHPDQGPTDKALSAAATEVLQQHGIDRKDRETNPTLD